MLRAPQIDKYRKVAKTLDMAVLGVLMSCAVTMAVLVQIDTTPKFILKLLSVIMLTSAVSAFILEDIVMWVWKLRSRRVMAHNRRIQQRGVEAGLRIARRARERIDVAEGEPFVPDETPDVEPVTRIVEGGLVRFGDTELALKVAGIEPGRLGGEFIVRLEHPDMNIRGDVGLGTLLDERGNFRPFTGTPPPEGPPLVRQEPTDVLALGQRIHHDGIWWTVVRAQDMGAQGDGDGGMQQTLELVLDHRAEIPPQGEAAERADAPLRMGPLAIDGHAVRPGDHLELTDGAAGVVDRVDGDTIHLRTEVRVDKPAEFIKLTFDATGKFRIVGVDDGRLIREPTGLALTELNGKVVQQDGGDNEQITQEGQGQQTPTDQVTDGGDFAPR